MNEAKAGKQKESWIKGAGTELRATARDLTAIRYRLLGVQASIPPSAQETSLEEIQGNPDVGTEMRAVIGGGILDCLDPLIEALLAAAELQP
jgi:hypothetical protein